MLVAVAGWRAESAAAPVQGAGAAPAEAPSLAAGGTPGASGGDLGNRVAREYFTDTILVDQDGREVRFYSDLMAGKVVVIHSMFTDCTGSCPVMSKKLQALQEHLGDRVGRDVHLISITVDPGRDTPARLKAHAAKFGAGPGWHLLTGSEENVRTVLSKLGQWVEDREAHETVFLIGNDRTGLWKKAFALAKTEQVVEIVDSVVGDPGAPG